MNDKRTDAKLIEAKPDGRYVFECQYCQARVIRYRPTIRGRVLCNSCKAISTDSREKVKVNMYLKKFLDELLECISDEELIEEVNTIYFNLCKENSLSRKNDDIDNRCIKNKRL